MSDGNGDRESENENEGDATDFSPAKEAHEEGEEEE